MWGMHWALHTLTLCLTTYPFETLTRIVVDEKSMNWTAFFAQLLQFSLARCERETIVTPVYLSFI
jgi:hypothetical protein